MSNLRIYVDVNTTNTTFSSFGVSPDKQVFVKNNHATDTLTVSINGATNQSSPLCENGPNGTKKTTFTVKPGDTDHYSICKDFTGTTFKYTAKIGNAAAEDPIVIIEKSVWHPIANSPATIFGAGLLLGIVVAMVFQAIMRSRSRNPA